MNGIIAAVFSTAACFIIHLIVFSTGFVKAEKKFRLKKLSLHLRSLLLIWMAVIPLFIFVFFSKASSQVITQEKESFDFVYGLIFFGILFFLYLAFYYVVDRSVSSRIMIEIGNSKDKKLKIEDIKKVYDADSKYKNELKGMIEGGFAKEEGGYYSNTAKGALWGKIVNWYKVTFQLGAGG